VSHWLERITAAAQSMTVQNVLTMAMLLMVAAPSYFAWRFLTDEDFRHEFTATARVIDANVDCLVLVTSMAGVERYTVVLPYAIRGRTEHIVGIRAPGALTGDEVAAACVGVTDASQMMLAAVRERAARETEGK
jgi:hypothetical protein